MRKHPCVTAVIVIVAIAAIAMFFVGVIPTKYTVTHYQTYKVDMGQYELTDDNGEIIYIAGLGLIGVDVPEEIYLARWEGVRGNEIDLDICNDVRESTMVFWYKVALATILVSLIVGLLILMGLSIEE